MFESVVGLKATSVCDFGRDLKQSVVLHVSRSCLCHCVCGVRYEEMVWGSVWRDGAERGSMELELGAWLSYCRSRARQAYGLLSVEQ
jgi:hypothetical protein